MTGEIAVRCDACSGRPSPPAPDYHTTRILGGVLDACCPRAWAARWDEFRRFFVERRWMAQGLTLTAGGLYDQPADSIEAVELIEIAVAEARRLYAEQKEIARQLAADADD